MSDVLEVRILTDQVGDPVVIEPGKNYVIRVTGEAFEEYAQEIVAHLNKVTGAQFICLGDDTTLEIQP